jgi:hypothetical protein
MLLSGPGAPVRPQVVLATAPGGARSVTWTYAIGLPAGGARVSLFHALAQVASVGNVDGDTLFRPYFWRGHVLGAGSDEDAVAAVVNFPRGALDDSGLHAPNAQALVALRELAERAGVERLDRDVLWVSAESQLLGKVDGSDLRVVTGAGAEQVVPLSEVAALQGGGGRGRGHRVFLRDGTVLAGTFSADGLQMTGGEGWTIGIEPGQLEYLFMSLDRRDGEPPSGANAIITMRSGEVWPVVLDPGDSLPFLTPWGPVEVLLGDVGSLSAVRDPVPRQRLVLADGSRLTGFVTHMAAAVVDPGGGGREIDFSSVVSLVRPGDPPPPEAEVADALSFSDLVPPVPEVGDFCLLRGGNLVAGRVVNPEIHVLTGTTVTTLSPDQVGSMARVDDDPEALAPKFEVMLGGGGRLVGHLRDEVVSVGWLGRTWPVPVQHFLAFRSGGGVRAQGGEVGR